MSKEMWNQNNSKKISDEIGDIHKTATMNKESGMIVNDVSFTHSTNMEIENSFMPMSNSYYTNSSLNFLEQLGSAIKTVKENSEITSDACDSLDKLNVHIKNLNDKYVEKREKEIEIEDLKTQYQNEPEEIVVGTDEQGNNITIHNDKKDDYKRLLEKARAEHEEILRQIYLLIDMIDARYTYIKNKYTCLKNLNQLLSDAGLNVTFRPNKDSLYGTDKLVLLTGREIKEKLNGAVLYDNNGQLREMIRGFEDDKEYYFVNTKISPIEYARYIGENSLHQSRVGGFMGSRCNELTYWYNKDMINGTTTSGEVMSKTTSGIILSTYIKSYSNGTKYENTSQNYANRFSDEKEINSYLDGDEIAKCAISDVYDMICNGIPAGLQVVIRENGEVLKGSKHWVSVVGFDASVTETEDVRYDNLITLDCATGILGVNDREIKSVYDDGLKEVVYRTSKYDSLYDILNTKLALYKNPNNSDKLMKLVDEYRNSPEREFYDYEMGDAISEKEMRNDIIAPYNAFASNEDKIVDSNNTVIMPYNKDTVYDKDGNIVAIEYNEAIKKYYENL